MAKTMDARQKLEKIRNMKEGKLEARLYVFIYRYLCQKYIPSFPDLAVAVPVYFDRFRIRHLKRLDNGSDINMLTYWNRHFKFRHGLKTDYLFSCCTDYFKKLICLH
jgi:hypothetical protein